MFLHLLFPLLSSPLLYRTHHLLLLFSANRTDEHHRLCAWADCKAPGDQHCAGCKKVFYCTREHQRLDWNRYHGEECKGEADSGGRILTPDLPAATAPFFDPMTSIYPSSVGLNSVVPEDIWDPGNTSICLDLKQVNAFLPFNGRPSCDERPYCVRAKMLEFNSTECRSK